MPEYEEAHERAREKGVNRWLLRLDGLESGAPLIPTAITGTERRRFHLPRSVQISFGEPIDVAGRESTPEAAAELLDDDLWPTIAEDYRKLKAGPGLIAAGVAAAGVGYLIQRRRRRG